MKHFTAQLSIILAVLFALTGFVPSNASGEYCVSEGGFAGYVWISGVELNGGANTNQDPEKATYSNYTGTTLSTLTKGQSGYTLKVTGYAGGEDDIYVNAWIDFDQSNSFNNISGEEFSLGKIAGSNSYQNFSTTLSFPSLTSLPSGKTRMRVTARQADEPGPCDNSFSGEVEDYTIGIAEDLNRELIINKNGTGTGTVTSGEVDPDPKKIDCGSTCSHTYTEGTEVVLTATPPATESIFMGWGGDGCSGTSLSCTTTVYNSPHNVTATFDLSSYVLWTNDEKGKGALWKINPTTGDRTADGAIPFPIVPPVPWKATGFEYIDNATAYVLWTNIEKGKASLWKINPQDGTRYADGAIPFAIVPPVPWTAESFFYVSDTIAYVLWSNTELGKGSLWKINPQDGTRYADGAIPFPIVPPVPWRATSFYYVDADTAYVLWTNIEKGKASLWKINPQDGTRYADGAIPFSIVPPVPWTAESFFYVDSTTGYVLWTNREKGKAALWKVNPQTGDRYADGGIPFSIVPPVPWEATSFFYRGSGQAASSIVNSVESQNFVVLRKSGDGQGTILAGSQSCGPDCTIITLPYEEGTSQTVETIPEEGSIFLGWQLENGSWLEDIHYALPGDVVFAVFEKE